jgi:hypothetical protein
MDTEGAVVSTAVPETLGTRLSMSPVGDGLVVGPDGAAETAEVGPAVPVDGVSVSTLVGVVAEGTRVLPIEGLIVGSTVVTPADGDLVVGTFGPAVSKEVGGAVCTPAGDSVGVRVLGFL